MPTLSHRNQKRRNQQAYRAIRDFDGSIAKMDRVLNINHFYLYEVINGEDCSPRLWKALLAADMVQPIPREQNHFMVPVDNLPLAKIKFAEWYPEVQLMKEWEVSEL